MLINASDISAGMRSDLRFSLILDESLGSDPSKPGSAYANAVICMVALFSYMLVPFDIDDGQYLFKPALAAPARLYRKQDNSTVRFGII